MLHIGQTFDNASTGEKIEIIKLPTEKDDEIALKSTLKKSGGFKVNHLHQSDDETFEVLSGTLTYKLNNIEQKASVGEKIFLPRGKAHAHWNNDDEDLVFVQTIKPCGDAIGFLETLFTMGAQGKLDKTGQPPFLQVMVWINDLENKTFLADIPVGIQKFLAFILSPLAKLLGYRVSYNKN